MINLARILEAKGNFTEALHYLKKGLAIREKVLEEGHPDTVSALAWIGVSFKKKIRNLSAIYIEFSIKMENLKRPWCHLIMLYNI